MRIVSKPSRPVNNSGSTIPASAKEFYLLRDRWRRGILISPLNSNDKVTALGLVAFVNRDHFSDTGYLEAWPSELTLAKILHRSRRSVQSGVASLVRSGMVARLHRGQRNSGSSRYRLSWDWLEKTELASPEATKLWPDKRLNGNSQGAGTRASTRSQGARTHTSMRNNPHLNAQEPVESRQEFAPNNNNRDNNEKNNDPPHALPRGGEVLSRCGEIVVEGHRSAPLTPPQALAKARADADG